MENIEKRLLNKGRLQGFVITFVIMLILFVIAAVITGLFMIGSGSFNYSAFYGKPSESIIDDQAENKIETLQSIID